MKKCLTIHSCDICQDYSKAYESLDDTFLFCYYKAYENANLDMFGNLKMPHNNFVNFISLLEVAFQLNFESLVLLKNVIRHFEDICNNFTYHHPCNDFPKKYLIRLFGRVKLFYTLKYINRNFRVPKNKKLIIWRNK